MSANLLIVSWAFAAPIEFGKQNPTRIPRIESMLPTMTESAGKRLSATRKITSTISPIIDTATNACSARLALSLAFSV